jgi:DNA-binding response OmpR family regulator
MSTSAVHSGRGMRCRRSSPASILVIDDEPQIRRLVRNALDGIRAFVKYSGRTLTHQQIFREVWGRAGGDAQAYLRVHIANLRRKIEADPVRPTLIVTEPGVGYRFELAS